MSIINDYLNGDIKKYKGDKVTVKDLKKGFYALIIGATITFIFFTCYLLITKNKKAKIEKNKCSTICEIIDVRENSGTYVFFEYSINGVLYTGRSVSPFGANVGDHYPLNYQCNEISNVEIKSDEILFTEFELKDTLSTHILSFKQKNDFFEFSFIDINNNIINKIQENNPLILDKLVNNKARVIYLKSNSNKAILK